MQFIITRSELIRRSKTELVVLKRAFEQAAAQPEHDPVTRAQILSTLADIRTVLLRTFR